MLASIIYNYGKFCDDFKSTLKLGAYDIWQQLGYRTKLRTTGLMALPMDVGILSAYKIEVH
jgi:hypothetical protein